MITTPADTSYTTGRAALLEEAVATPTRTWQPRRTIERIIVALDGEAESDAAVRVADAIATVTGAELDGLLVREPTIDDHTSVPDGDDVEPPPEAGVPARAKAASDQVARVLGETARCPVVVRTGPVVAEVARRAQDVRADLIVTGRGNLGRLEWLIGEERLLRLLRRTPCAVLAVEDRLRSQPRRIVVGVDFSRDAETAARLAVVLGASNAAIYLVHVKPDPPFGIPHPGRWLRSYEDAVRAGLEKLRSDLALPASRVVETIVVHGHPGVALAEFARTAQADLIATGVQGAAFLDRLVIGSVTSYLVRAARVSLLLVPGERVRGAPRRTA